MKSIITEPKVIIILVYFRCERYALGHIIPTIVCIYFIEKGRRWTQGVFHRKKVYET